MAASVGLKELNLSVQTDRGGNFTIAPVKPGRYTLQVTHPQAHIRSYAIRVRRNFYIEISLKEEAYLERIESRKGLAPIPPGASFDNGGVVSNAISVLGFSPNYFTMLPGVSKGVVFFENPIVRSQDPSLNSYSLNGLVLDNAFHLFGIFAGVNHHRIDGVKVSRGVIELDERDLQGAGRIDYSLEANPRGSNRAELGLTITQLNGRLDYIISPDLYGSISLRRTYADLLVVQEQGDSTAYMLDFQGHNVWQIQPRHRLRLVYYGLQDKLELSAADSSTFEGNLELANFAQNLSYDYELQKKQIVQVDLRYRYAKKEISIFDNSLLERNHLVNVAPRFHYEFSPFQLLTLGVDAFVENRRAGFSSTTDIFSLDLPAGLSLPSLSYNSDTVVNNGLLVGYRARFGRLHLNNSARFDRYNDLKKNTVSLASQASYAITEKWAAFAGAGLYHKRPDTLELTGGPRVAALSPEQALKAEGGASFRQGRLQLKGSLFYLGWRNLIKVAPFVADDYEASGLYQNNGRADAVGAEFSALYKVAKLYLRAGYTFQTYKSGSAFASYHRPHIFNSALIYYFKQSTLTSQLRVWSNVRSLVGKKNDMMNPITQLDLRYDYRFSQSFSAYIEGGQLLNPVYLAAKGERREYFDEGTFSQVIFGAAEDNDATRDLPFHLSFGVQVLI